MKSVALAVLILVAPAAVSAQGVGATGAAPLPTQGGVGSTTSTPVLTPAQMPTQVAPNSTGSTISVPGQAPTPVTPNAGSGTPGQLPTQVVPR